MSNVLICFMRDCYRKIEALKFQKRLQIQHFGQSDLMNMEFNRYWDRDAGSFIGYTLKATIPVTMASFYFHHTVSHTNMCLNILWRLLCWLQFFSQCCHKYPQRSYIVIPTAAPDILCDKGMGQYLADILG